MMAPAGAARRACGALAWLCAVALAGCATPGFPPAPPQVRELSEVAARHAVTTWQQRLDRHVAAAGGRDPAVLAQQPALRSPSALRPARIVFTATDVEATTADRDGHDVSGLLVGRVDTAAGRWHLFIVGVVERRQSRPVALVDVRVAARLLHGGDAAWTTGPADGAALARYARRLDATSALRFPGDLDRFRVVDCAPHWCVEETVSGASWRVELPLAAARAG